MPAKGQSNVSHQELIRRAEQYFIDCDNSRVEYTTRAGVPCVRQTPYTMIGLANAIGVSRKTLYEYMAGKYPSDGTEEGDAAQHLVRDTLMRMRDRVEQYTVEHAALGDIDNRIAQLLMSGWGYKERHEVEHSGGMAVTWQGSTAQEAEEWSR